MLRTCRTVTAGRAIATTACAVVTIAALPVGAASAQLPPGGKIGPVKNLSMDITKPSSYRVLADWDALPNATAYRVALTDASGTVLASTKTTADQWDVARDLAVGTNVTVKVTPLEGKRSGRAATVVGRVPDLTPPSGSFDLAQTERAVLLTQLSLQDDLSALSAVVRMVDWGEGAGFEPWAVGSTLAHLYPSGKRVYHPAVKLTDQAGNSTVIALAAVAIDDFEAPQGAFAVAPGTAWATYTPVSLTQLGALSDDLSLAENIRRTVDWQDGSAPTEWTGSGPLTHVYATAGSFAPTVTLTDEANRQSVIPLAEVLVAVDEVKPRAALRKPRVRRDAIRSWTTLRGSAKDPLGSGVRDAQVRVIEKRGDAWFAYRAGSRSWVNSGTKTRAWRQSRAASVTPVAGRWSAPLHGLRKGVLVVQLSARDNVGNTSVPVSHTQSITRR